MPAEDRENKTGSPKVEVGEIDTGTPFQSVKDAVNLFGEGAFSGEKSPIRKLKPHSAERALVKETKLHLAQKELYKLKEQLKSAETTKAGALTELKQAKSLVVDLTKKLKITNEAKEAAIKMTNNQANQFESTETNPNGKRVQKLAHKAALEESAKKLLALREQADLEKSKNLETQFAETTSEVARLQMEMENARISDLDSVKTVTLELDGAKDSLHKFVEEERSLRKLLESLKIELENIKKEHEELKLKETEREFIDFTVVTDETMLTFQQLVSENENAKRESEEMKKKAEEMKKEAEAMKDALKEAESKLNIILMEAKEAKEAESGLKITISREEFEALSRKVMESEKLEAAQREIDDLRAAADAALKRAEVAEAGKKTAEGELRRWREREQKKLALILKETQMQQSPSPNHKQSPPHKQKTKKVFTTSLSSMFHRKKSQVDIGSSPSYLPGEKPM
ncbi:WEB family protein At5g55860-like [Bidens hawaiensis]|uniref:WEB family protein At5g55860-like n=1 Tax=Bidens hawaiensis TaxID=980011 RepID=UPI004049BB31